MAGTYARKKQSNTTGVIVGAVLCTVIVATVFLIGFLITRTDDAKTYAYLPDHSVYFYDVADDFAWAHHEIDALAVSGIVTGEGDHLFYPGRPITRADFLIMLNRAYNMTSALEDGTIPLRGTFVDVPDDAYYCDAVLAAHAFGVADGIQGNQFLPENNVTRQDAMVFLKRTLDCTGVTLRAKALSLYADGGEVQEYARESVAALTGAGIFESSDGWLRPYALVTRAEMAVMLYRATHLTESNNISYYEAQPDIVNVCIGTQIYSDVVITNYNPENEYHDLMRYSEIHTQNGITCITLQENQPINRQASYSNGKLVLNDPNNPNNASVTYPLAKECAAIDVTAPYHQLDAPVSTGGTYLYCIPSVENGEVTTIYYQKSSG